MSTASQSAGFEASVNILISSVFSEGNIKKDILARQNSLGDYLMKKSLLALAVLGAFAGAASAQTSVTIYGSFDAGVRSQTNVDAAGNSKLTMGSNGTYNSNRIGFKGTEDLGGGMDAHFTLESGFNSGTGALDNANNQLFNRTALVGIGGAWGKVDLGRQYTNAFQTIAAYDPMNYKFTGIALAVPATAGVRYNNDIKYTGTFDAVTVRAEYALGEVAGNSSAGSNKSVGISYKAGPLALGGAYSDLRSAADLQTKHYTIGGAYTFGPARLAVGYADQKATVNAAGGETQNKFSWIGLNYAVSPVIEITPAFYRNKQSGVTAAGVAGSADGKKDLLMLSATYAFSKRTSFYALIDQAKLEGALNTVSPQDRQRDIAVGINHVF